MNLQKAQSIIPFISFPLGIAALLLLLIEFAIRASLISQNPLSQLILFAGFITNIALLLLSFRAMAQVLSQKANKIK
jgi:hypothetical protein